MLSDGREQDKEEDWGGVGGGGGGISAELSCQTFGPMATRLSANS